MNSMCVCGAGNVTDGLMRGTAVTKNIFLDSVPAARLTFRNTLRFRHVLNGGFPLPVELQVCSAALFMRSLRMGIESPYPLVPEPFFVAQNLLVVVTKRRTLLFRPYDLVAVLGEVRAWTPTRQPVWRPALQFWPYKIMRSRY